MSNANLIPVLLLLVLGLALALGTIVVLSASRWQRRFISPRRKPDPGRRVGQPDPAPGTAVPHLPRPTCWVAVRARKLGAVQTALHLSNPRPCTWTQGLLGSDRLFIAPSVKGWILITGSGLPDPSDDVDACFRFLLHLSRELGRVQFFMANRVLGHHAWVRAESGRVMRAYAWAGQTLWDQGRKTAGETELGLTCYRYCEAPSGAVFGPPDSVWTNAEKVPMLAARWSLDPAALDERSLRYACGVAGEVPRLF